VFGIDWSSTYTNRDRNRLHTTFMGFVSLCILIGTSKLVEPNKLP